jgi:two-component SAPR family response regulator
MWGLLGLLAEHRSRWLTRETVIERLWNGGLPSRARFDTLLSYVRGRLCEVMGYDSKNGGKLVIEYVNGRGYRLNADLFTCDVWQVRDLLAMAGKADSREKADIVARALQLYGPYLDGLEYGWADAAARRLRAALVHALVDLAELESKTAPDRAVVYLEQAIELEPLNEPLYRQQMKLYALLGRTEPIRHCYRLLDERLKASGTRPDPQTCALHQRLTDGA